ncbi:hypothetical protein SAMD00023353_1201640 [Rosellinia necatrix]|uniref:Uncharacterized protein n=1 Tax=Rosellinia necatrix TaxID=77044 RepID=A0A1S8A6W2_ROSNE|nr:hypothetical protein SAMD00023353_1201640 [Rosellinia necatrix]
MAEPGPSHYVSPPCIVRLYQANNIVSGAHPNMKLAVLMQHRNTNSSVYRRHRQKFEEEIRRLNADLRFRERGWSANQR